MPRYKGSCHCGLIRFEINAVIERVMECSCAICRKRGFVHCSVAPEKFRLITPESDVGVYVFGSLVTKHHFCWNCGVHVFTRPLLEREPYTVNMRVMDNYGVRNLLKVAMKRGKLCTEHRKQ